MQIIITRAKKENEEEIMKLFSNVITHTFKVEGAYDVHPEDIQKEIDKKHVSLLHDFESNGKDEYFLIARIANKIVGIAAFGEPNMDIKKYYSDDVQNIPEIKNLYILPEYQGQGIGSRLFSEIINVLQQRGFSTFYLDSGYKGAQDFWKKKLGKPALSIADRWGAGKDYLIWKCELRAIISSWKKRFLL